MSELRGQDESLLIDFLLGRCQEADARAIRGRMASDANFARLHQDLRNTLAALKLLPTVEPKDDLVQRTMARIQSARRFEAQLAREELKRRVVWPTFSLREAAAVAAAIVIMVGLIVPCTRQASARRLVNECCSNVGQVGAALRTYANDHEFRLPASQGASRRWLPSSAEPVASNSAGLFRLVHSGYNSPVAFQCPAVSGGSFVVQPEMADFPEAKYIGYSYQHSMGGDDLRVDSGPQVAQADSMAILADATPVFADGQFRPQHVRDLASENHQQTGQNVLYLDMHVDWHTSAAAGVRGNNIYLAEGIYDYKGDESPVSSTDSFLLPAFVGTGILPSR